MRSPSSLNSACGAERPPALLRERGFRAVARALRRGRPVRRARPRSPRATDRPGRDRRPARGLVATAGRAAPLERGRIRERADRRVRAGGRRGACVEAAAVLSLEHGRIARHQVYSARPHSAAEAPPPSRLAERLLADVGEVVTVEPLVHPGQAGGWIERAKLADGRTVIVKRVVPERDLLSRVAGLEGSIEGLLWQSGALAQLPESIDTAIIAAGREDGETVLVMRDVSDALVGISRPLTRAESSRFLDALATIHRTFGGQRYDFLCPLRSYLQMLAPATLRASRRRGRRHHEGHIRRLGSVRRRGAA